MGGHTHKKNKLRKRMKVNRFIDLMKVLGPKFCTWSNELRMFYLNTFKILISIVKHIFRTVVEEQNRILFKRFLTLVDALKMAPKSKKYKTSYSVEMKSTFPFIRKCSSSVPNYQHKHHSTICNLNLSLTSGSSNDILPHSETPGHKEKAKYLKSKKKNSVFL